MKKIFNPLRKRIGRGLLPPYPEASSHLQRVFYCHVPKCAGSSIASGIYDSLYRNHTVGRFGIDLEASQTGANCLELDMMKVREIVLSYELSIPANYFGAGHCYCRPQLVESFLHDWDFLTVLRNPVERWVSEFVYNTYKDLEWAKNKLSLEDYLCSPVGQETARKFLYYFSDYSGEIAQDTRRLVKQSIDNLSNFSVVGSLSHIEEWEEALFKKFQINKKTKSVNKSPQNELKNKILDSKELTGEIQRLCADDILIYEGFFDSVADGKGVYVRE